MDVHGSDSLAVQMLPSLVRWKCSIQLLSERNKKLEPSALCQGGVTCPRGRRGGKAGASVLILCPLPSSLVPRRAVPCFILV